ncbi:MAG: lysophospholipid acyltransferase family protein [Vicinamibacterales bacterium]|nr:lysophospholipid acyltransferase family protein [Vicinamibacterales bacterium]MDP7672101.1 lysophospholipid acyltransferase family protein [Vicinamibacterales bacterium]HJO39587.1 lysophospholipid acyltransferase family protein [Vicinamibacterales bacterium]
MSIPPFHWWRTVFFLIPAIGVYTLVLGVLSLGSSVFGGYGDFGHRCARAWSWLILATTGVDVDVHGRELVTPGEVYVFTSNHQSIYDIPIIFWSLPFQLRIIAKASLGRFPVLGWHLARTGHVLVDRSRPGTEAFRRITTIMARGRSLIVFPEGTRSIDGRLRRFKKAIFVLAIEAGLPVVPVSVTGSRHVMRRGWLMTCPGQVKLTLHRPIATTGLSRDDAADLAERVQRIVETAVDCDGPDGGEAPE